MSPRGVMAAANRGRISEDTPWAPPSVEEARIFQDKMHPRQPDGGKYDLWRTSTGRYALLGGFGKQLDLWDEVKGIRRRRTGGGGGVLSEGTGNINKMPSFSVRVVARRAVSTPRSPVYTYPFITCPELTGHRHEDVVSVRECETLGEGGGRASAGK